MCGGSPTKMWFQNQPRLRVLRSCRGTYPPRRGGVPDENLLCAACALQSSLLQPCALREAVLLVYACSVLVLYPALCALQQCGPGPPCMSSFVLIQTAAATTLNHVATNYCLSQYDRCAYECSRDIKTRVGVELRLAPTAACSCGATTRATTINTCK